MGTSAHMSSPLLPGQDLAHFLFSDLSQSFPSLMYRGQGRLPSLQGSGLAPLLTPPSLLCRDQGSACAGARISFPLVQRSGSASPLPPMEGSGSVPFLVKRLGVSSPSVQGQGQLSPSQFLHRDGSTVHVCSSTEEML